MLGFADKLLAAAEANRSLVCVGLDPDPASMPVSGVAEFNRAIVDATHDLVCAFKPNLAFYEALGVAGLESLNDTIKHIRDVAPSVVIIGDAKRGDVESTNVFHARALFDYWDFDAVTVNGWAGGEALEPFLTRQDRGVLVWCKSSDPGAADVQDLNVKSNGVQMEMHHRMALRSREWNTRGNVGIVVGSNFPGEVARARAACPDMALLAPGVGAQGGALAASVKAGMDDSGRNVIIAASRSVLYASQDPEHFAEASRRVVMEMREQISSVLSGQDRGWC